jgi:hypothetical protein
MAFFPKAYNMIAHGRDVRHGQRYEISVLKYLSICDELIKQEWHQPDQPDQSDQQYQATLFK